MKIAPSLCIELNTEQAFTVCSVFYIRSSVPFFINIEANTAHLPHYQPIRRMLEGATRDTYTEKTVFNIFKKNAGAWKKFFQRLKNFFHALKKFFQGMKKNFQGMAIILKIMTERQSAFSLR